jgi:flagellar biosynthesis protein FliP
MENSLSLGFVLSGFGLSIVALPLLLFLALIFSSYLKIATILSIVRFGLGINTLPAIFVTGALSLALSLFVMYPTLEKATGAMDGVFIEGGVTEQNREKAINAAAEVWKSFLKARSSAEELSKFVVLAKQIDARQQPSLPALPESSATNSSAVESESLSNSWRIIAPAYIVSELRTAFAVGLNLLLPFLVVDLLVINFLGAMAFERVAPEVISVPLKILLFVVLDGWALISKSLVLA